MGFLSDIWDGTKQALQGIGKICSAIIDGIVEAVWFVMDAVFSVFEHLFAWIDDVIDELLQWGISLFGGHVITIPPEVTQTLIDELEKGDKITLGPKFIHKPKTIVAAADSTGRVQRAQVVVAGKGFEDEIQKAFDRGHIYKNPIEQG